MSAPEREITAGAFLAFGAGICVLSLIMIIGVAATGTELSAGGPMTLFRFSTPIGVLVLL